MLPGSTPPQRSLIQAWAPPISRQQSNGTVMNQMVFLMFFFATAPIALMPSIIALFTRHKARLPIVIVNLALWTLIFFAARSFTLGTSSKFQLPTLLALAAWLVLLGYSVRGRSLPTRK